MMPIALEFAASLVIASARRLMQFSPLIYCLTRFFTSLIKYFSLSCTDKVSQSMKIAVEVGSETHDLSNVYDSREIIK